MRLNVLLRGARIAVSVAVLAVLTLSPVLYGAGLPAVPAWLSRMQLLPAAASFALGVFVTWIAVTLLLGRVYCSSVCPLGTAMDLVARLRNLFRPPHRCGQRRDYRYRRPMNRLRYIVLVAVLTCLIGGLMAVPALTDPFTAYERFCSACLRPLWVWAGGEAGPVPAAGPPEPGAPLYAPLQMAMGSLTGVLVALVTMLVIGVLAWRGGRVVCNTLCPVGTTLGIVSRYAVFQPDIDTDKCTQCRRCEQVCKARCIDLTDHVVDGSRCVDCFDCINVCPNDAIRYTATRKQLSIPMMQRTDTALRPQGCDAHVNENQTPT